MLISYRKKFIFIHNYKVAGSSIGKALRPYAVQKNPTAFHRFNMLLEFLPDNIFGRNYRLFISKKVNALFGKKSSFPSHLKARQIKAMAPEKLWDTSFKFGFVRNPWDWQVSYYHYGIQTRGLPQFELIKSMNFDKYIEWRVHGDKPLQKDFFYNNDTCLVDFIGRFENLREDFQVVCRRIGIDVEMPHVNASKRKQDYRRYYNAKTRDLVDKYFREDIEIFGYEF